MNTSKNNLQGLPPICYINVERQMLRKEAFEKQCEVFGISEYVRIEGYDAHIVNVATLVSGSVPTDVSTVEIACVLSHVKALKYFVENTDHSRMLICEDDMRFEMSHYWNFNWEFFESHLPYDWDIVQLVVNNPVSMHLNLHIRFINDFSAACYLISKRYAEKLLSLHCAGELYKIDQVVKPRAVADALLYNAGRTYSIPLFTTVISSEGAINEEFYPLQQGSNNKVIDFWKKTSLSKDVNLPFISDYNPYLNQLPPEVYNPAFPDSPKK